MSEKQLVRPAEPVTLSIARVELVGNVVRVFFPEKLPAFRDVVRRLGYAWQAPWWARQVEQKAAADRAAELCRHLLGAGFCVKADAGILEMALTERYRREPRRLVLVQPDGQYAGWFKLWWARDEDCYAAARRLPGARYSPPCVLVPAEQYEQVLDFAGLFGFELTPRARAVAEAARQEMEEAMVVDLAPTEGKRYQADERPPVLEVPAEVEIAPSLCDEEGY